MNKLSSPKPCACRADNPTDIVAIHCRYNKLADIEKVLQGQAINLVDALKNGKIPPIELPDTENGLTSADDITGRLQDAFDAAELARNSFGRREQHEANKAAKAAAAAAAGNLPPTPPSAN